MRVFVSSTCYDLIDVRDELAEMLRALGVSPVLSDDKLSDFKIVPDANSIETCLINVEASDAVIVILDKRYGPRLGKFGFEDISATHLEYRRAKEKGKPIYLYVRDRLEADHSTWRKNKTDFRGTWVTREEDHGLFDFIEEHRKLTTDLPVSNWFAPFRTSVDLKEAVRVQLGRVILTTTVAEAIAKNQFPVLVASVAVDHQQSGPDSLRSVVELKVRNRGETSAFRVRVLASKGLTHLFPSALIAIGPDQEHMFGLQHPSIALNDAAGDLTLYIAYDSYTGVRVQDEYKFRFLDLTNTNGGYSFNQAPLLILIARTLHLAAPVRVEISDCETRV